MYGYVKRARYVSTRYFPDRATKTSPFLIGIGARKKRVRFRVLYGVFRRAAHLHKPPKKLVPRRYRRTSRHKYDLTVGSGLSSLFKVAEMSNNPYTVRATRSRRYNRFYTRAGTYI